MITYNCHEVDENGACVPGKMYVFISSREPTISEEKKQSLFLIVNQLCIDPNTLVTYDNSGKKLNLVSGNVMRKVVVSNDSTCINQIQFHAVKSVELLIETTSIVYIVLQNFLNESNIFF